MIELKFSFEEKSTNAGVAFGVAGMYRFLSDPPIVEVYLPNIAHTQLAFIGEDFGTMFKSDYVEEIEQNMRDIIYETLEHEYIHVSLGHTECPLNKQHFFIEKMRNIYA